MGTESWYLPWMLFHLRQDCFGAFNNPVLALAGYIYDNRQAKRIYSGS